MADWGPTIDSVVVIEEFTGLAGQVWDYAPEIQDAGMIEEFARLFTTWAVARIFDPEEMRPAFDSDGEEGGDDGDD